MASGNAGKGRPPGVPNKNSGALKDMILQALDGAGGVAYLQRQADENPGPFMTLIGKVLPMQITGGDPGSKPVEIKVKFVKPDGSTGDTVS